MLYMFTRVFGNFHLIYGDYFVISSSIPSNLFMLAKMPSCKSVFIHPLKLGQPNSLRPFKFILLNSKSSQISSTKQTLSVFILQTLVFQNYTQRTTYLN